MRSVVIAHTVFLLQLASSGRAEESIVTTPTTMRRRPGEASQERIALAEGTALEILRRRGRWLFVEVDGQRGWILRTSVAAPRARRKAHVDVEGARSRWRDETAIRTGDAAVSPSPAPSPAPAAPIAEGRGTRLTVGAQAGVATRTLLFSSNGATPLANYRLSADALTAVAHAGAAAQVYGRLLLAADLVYAGSLSVPGVRSPAPGGGTFSLALHQVTATGRMGWQMRSASRAAVWLRGGGRFALTWVETLDNELRMPRESLLGPVAGLALELPSLGRHGSLEAMVDVLPWAKGAQSTQLMDGARGRAWGVYAELRASYALGPSYGVDLAYQYEWTRHRWKGDSTRQPDVTRASRVDVGHALLVGLRAGF